MERSLEFVRQRADMQREREAIEQERRRNRPQAKTERQHLVCFHMTPFSKDFDKVGQAIR